MIVNRVWAMPNCQTFRIPPIKELVTRYTVQRGINKVIVDPFANGCKIGTITNDLNLKFDTTYHLDALDFLKLIEDESADVVLYNPPYSLRQVKECYEGVGITVTAVLLCEGIYQARCENRYQQLSSKTVSIKTLFYRHKMTVLQF